MTRSEWLGHTAAVGTGLAAGEVLAAVLPAPAVSAPSTQGDTAVLNYLLAYEELQARFYAHAVQSGKLASPWREFANVVKGHEDAHVAFLRQRLGGAARPSPAFQLGVEATNLAAFPHVAVTLEDAGVALYNGQAANLTASSLAAVATIMSVESRHAAWVRALAGEIPAPLAVDPADSQSQVQSQVAAVGVRTS